MASVSPQLRFPAFDDDWSPQHLSDYFTPSREKGYDGLPTLSVTLTRGLVLRDKNERKTDTNLKANEHLLVRESDIAYNMMRMWQGAFGRAYADGIVSPAYVVLRPKDETDSEFFAYAFRKARSIYLFWAYSYGLTNDRLRLYANDFLRIPFRAPSLPEQHKITEFLTLVDTRIEQLTKKKSLLEDYKKGVMQQLFSRSIRFKDDNGNDFPDWKDKKLGEVCEIVNGLTYSPSDIEENGLLVLRSSNVQKGRIALDDNVFVSTEVPEWNLTRPNDILICVRNGSKTLIGKNAIIPEGMPRSTHGAFMTVLRGSQNEFVFQLLQTDVYRRNVHINLGATINSINGNNLRKFKFQFPHPDEQSKISDFLSAIDQKIEKVADQIIHTQSFKKGLLQQMFV